MSYFSIQLAPRAVGLLLSLFAVNSIAQTPHHHADMATANPVAAAPASPRATSGLDYVSVFARYKPYRDEKTGSWREANDSVERIGGWRIYAKEAQQPDSAAPATPDPHAGKGVKP